MNKKRYFNIAFFFAIILFLIMILILANNNIEKNELICNHVEEGINSERVKEEVHFYFDLDNKNVIKTDFTYYLDNSEDKAILEDDIYFYNEAYCKNLHNNSDSCKVNKKEDSIIIEVIYDDNIDILKDIKGLDKISLKETLEAENYLCKNK